ncbi:MAG: hypothetical protein ACPGVB_09550 [Chitinophagales bacterium]
MKENQEELIEVNEKSAKPDWITTLERESWQPELLISGLAIFAAMQFPALIADLQLYLAFNFDKEMFMYATILTSYLSIASYAIAINFSIHFALRVFWIGVLGLMSVYPEGIDYENYPYGGKKFVGKLRQKLTTLEDFSIQIDRVCSIIFASSGLIVLSLVSACILVSSVFVLSLVVKFLLPDYWHDYYNNVTLGILGVIVSLFTVVISLFNYTKLKHTAFADKYHFTIYWIYSSLFFNILNRPFHYLSMTFSTNNSATKMNVFAGLYIVALSGFVGLKTLVEVGGIETRDYYAEESNEYALNPLFYDNLRPQHRYATRPSIPSDVIEGKFVKLFVPYTKRLDVKLKEMCKSGGLKKEDSMSDFEHSQLQNKVYLECFEELYSVYLNDDKLQEIDWHFYQHSNKEEEGLISYISTDSLEGGKNVLRIEEWHSEEEKEKEKEAKIFEIPFWLGK